MHDYGAVSLEVGGLIILTDHPHFVAFLDLIQTLPNCRILDLESSDHQVEALPQGAYTFKRSCRCL
jgi:hypothetical protein